MKKFLIRCSSFLLALVLAAGVIPPVEIAWAAESTADVWDGTITMPTQKDQYGHYLISTAEELAYIAQTGGVWLERFYYLENDLILNEETLTVNDNGDITNDTSTLNKWTPIGSKSTPFTGYLQGKGHTISGLYVDGGDYSGLVGYSTSTYINQLFVENAYVRGNDYVGGIAGYLNDTYYECAILEDVYFTGYVKGNNYVGGLAGYSDTDYAQGFSNVYHYAGGGTWGNSYVGGIVGYATGDNQGLGYCGNRSPVSGSSNVGGVSGYGGRSFYHCWNSGRVTGSGSYVGGVLGWANECELKDCHNTGEIAGSGLVGGIAGRSTDSAYNGCTNEGKIGNNRGSAVGGIIGSGPRNTIIECENTGSVYGGDYVGGIAGENYEYGAEIENCRNAGIIDGRSNVGGILGYGRTVVESVNEGSVFGNGEYVGGIVGYFTSNIENCVNRGTAEGNDFVAGIAGGSEGNILYCGNLGEVSATGNGVGGVVGQSFYSVLMSCYNTATIKGKTVGGILGRTDESVDLFDCINIGNVISISDAENSLIGALAGYGSLPSNCHYLKTDSINAGLTGKFGSSDTEAAAISHESIDFFCINKDGTLNVVGHDYGDDNICLNCGGTAAPVSCIRMKELPYSLTYVQNMDSLKVTGATIEIVYENGTVKEAEVIKSMVSGFDNTVLGEQTLTVSYGEYTTNFKVTVVPKFQITQQPKDLSVTENAMALFDIAAEGVDVTCHWESKAPDSSEWVSCTEESPTVCGVGVSAKIEKNGYQYRCVLTDKNGAQLISDAVTLSIVDTAILIQPQDLNVTYGKTPRFRIVAGGNVTAFQWEERASENDAWVKVNASAEGEDSSGKYSLLQVAADESQSGHQFRCTVTDDAGNQLVSEIVTLTAVKPQIGEMKVPLNVEYQGADLSFEILQASGNGISYQWQKKVGEGWTDLTGETGAELVIECASAAKDNGVYRCVITDDNGNQAISGEAVLEVKLPEITLQPQDVSTTYNKWVFIPLATKGYQLSYVWEYKLPGGEWTYGASGDDYSEGVGIYDHDRFGSGTQFRCIITDPTGYEMVSDAATLTVVKIEIIRQPEDTEVAKGGNASFAVEAAGNGITYQWQKKSGEEWTDLSGQTEPSLIVEAVGEEDEGEYRCVITDDNENKEYSETAALSIGGPVITKQPESETAVYGDEATFIVEADGLGLSYQWNEKDENGMWMVLAGATQRQLSVTADDGNIGKEFRCVITDSRGRQAITDTVILEVALEILEHPESVSCGEGTEVVLSVTAVGKDLSYQWKVRAGEEDAWKSCTVSGSQTNSIILTAVPEMNGYQYRCEVTGGEETCFSEAATLTVEETAITADLQSQYNFVAGDEVTLFVKTNSPILQYQWQEKVYGEAEWLDIEGADQSEYAFTVGKEQSGNKFRCLIMDAAGEQILTSKEAQVNVSYPYFTDEPDDDLVSVNRRARFYAGASGTGLTYEWQVKKTADGEWEDVVEEIHDSFYYYSGEDHSYMEFDARLEQDGWQYRCVITDRNGNTATSKATLTVVAAPTIAKQPEDKTAAPNQRISFEIERDIGSCRWQVKKAGSSIWEEMPGETSVYLYITTTEADNGNQYRCIVTDENNVQAISDPATLTVIPLKITKQPENASAFYGEEVTLSVEAEGKRVQYVWQRLVDGEWKVQWGENGNPYTTTVYDDAQYRCYIVDDGRNEIYSDAVTVSMLGPVINVDPEDQTVHSSGNDYYGNARFDIYAAGLDAAFQWQISRSEGVWEDIPGETDYTCYIAGTEENDGAKVRCVVTDSKGQQAISDEATLTVLWEFSILSHPENVICEAGEWPTMSVHAKGDDVTYQWQVRLPGESWKNTSTRGSKTDTITIEATTARNGYAYRCIVTNGDGRQFTSDSALLVVNAASGSKVSITKQPQNLTADAGTKVKMSLSATGEGLKYQWQIKLPGENWKTTTTSGATTNTITISATAARNGYQYRCVVTDANGNSVTSNAATLTVKAATAPLTITKQPQDLTAEAGTKVKMSLSATGEGLSYQWQIKLPGENWKTTTTSGATTNTITISATAARNGYQYRCVVTDSNGNSVTSNAATLTVKAVTAPLTITKQPENLTAEAGTKVKMSVAASGEGLKYQWQIKLPGENWKTTTTSGATTNTITISATAARNGYQYRCVVTDTNGNSVTSDAATLTVKAVTAPLAITKQPQNLTAEAGTKVKMSVAATGEGLSYQWQIKLPGENWKTTTTSGATTNTITISATAARNGYQYRCVVTDANGNSVTSNAATLTVKAATAPLTITKQPQDLTADAGTKVKMSLSATGEGLSYQWEIKLPGENWKTTTTSGATTNTITISATEARNGYQYRCVITDANGNSVTSNAATLTVKMDPAITK